MCVVLLHIDYLNWENWGLGLPKRRGPGKKVKILKVKILAGGKILEVGEIREMCGDKCRGTCRNLVQ